MDIRTAILRAADHIERNPREFNYWSIVTPEHPGCGTPGCALGWIGFFANIERGCRYGAEVYVAPVLVSADDGFSSAYLFYRRMDAVCDGRGDWRFSASLCAATLRKYADAFHPATPIKYPNWWALASAPEPVSEGGEK